MGKFNEKIADDVRVAVLGDTLRASQNISGQVFWVVEDSDPDFGLMVKRYGVKNVFTTVTAANAATTSNRNDIIFISSHTGHALTAMLTVSNNKVHFIGMGGDGRIGDQRTRITLGVTTAATDVALIKVTGQGCTFRNIKFANSNTLSQSVTCFQDESPNGLLVLNCSIHSLGSAQLTATGGSALRLAGDGSQYSRCQIGADTITNTVANQVVHVATINSAVAKRVVFDECEFYTLTSATTHVFVRVSADGDIDRYITFNRCGFHNFNTSSNGALMAVAFATPAGLVSGLVHVAYPAVFGATDLATAAVGNAGMLVIGDSPTAGTSGISVQPTA